MQKKTILLGIVVLSIIAIIYAIEHQRASTLTTEEGSIELVDKGEQRIVKNPTELNSTIESLEDENERAKRIVEKEKQYQRAPELVGIQGYLNTEDGLKISDLDNKVVLVDFWTYTCINCIRTLPHLNAWNQKYGDKGLVIIGVHTPEFAFEKEYENVRIAVEKYGIKYPVVLDNDYKTWRAYQNRYWPHKYLIDVDGFIRYDHIGEGSYDETEEKIRELLTETGVSLDESTNVQDLTPQKRGTPELYTGYDFAIPRGQNIGNDEGLQRNQMINYTFPSTTRKNTIYLSGLWKSNPENLESSEKNGSLLLDYEASSVNFVAMPLENGNPVRVFVSFDNHPLPKTMAGEDVQFTNDTDAAFILVSEPRLYNVIKSNEWDMHLLILTAEQEGFVLSAFTFG
ncbi:thioredoxin family protein [Candidatus Woesearchaeota archaeon]|nr:thioredoxin family protein [Candidatus Woesearchaeota archaeon]